MTHKLKKIKKIHMLDFYYNNYEILMFLYNNLQNSFSKYFGYIDYYYL